MARRQLNVVEIRDLLRFSNPEARAFARDYSPVSSVALDVKGALRRAEKSLGETGLKRILAEECISLDEKDARD